MRCSGTDESEWRANMDADDNVPRVIRRRMQHTIVRETSVVYNVVDLAVFPEWSNVILSAEFTAQP